MANRVDGEMSKRRGKGLLVMRFLCVEKFFFLLLFLGFTYSFRFEEKKKAEKIERRKGRK